VGFQVAAAGTSHHGQDDVVEGHPGGGLDLLQPGQWKLGPDVGAGRGEGVVENAPRGFSAEAGRGHLGSGPSGLDGGGPGPGGGGQPRQAGQGAGVVGQSAADQPDPAGQRCRGEGARPRDRSSDLVGEHPGEDGVGRHAVGQAVLVLEDHRLTATFEPVDQGRLPQGMSLVQVSFGDPGEQGVQGGGVTGGRNPFVTKVEGEVEIGIVDHDRMVEAQRHPHHPPPERRKLIEAILQVGSQIIEGHRCAVGGSQHTDRHGVHGLTGQVHVQEPGIFSRQAHHLRPPRWVRQRGRRWAQ
jgi:hypothetical protein